MIIRTFRGRVAGCRATGRPSVSSITVSMISDATAVRTRGFSPAKIVAAIRNGICPHPHGRQAGRGRRVGTHISHFRHRTPARRRNGDGERPAR